MRARSVAIVVFVLLALANEAQGEPAPSSPPSATKVQTVGPRLLCVPAMPIERCITLPPGRFVDEGTWQRIDRETRELQERTTRLDAENKSLRESAAGWQPGWKTLLGTLVVGFTSGITVYHYVRD